MKNTFSEMRVLDYAGPRVRRWQEPTAEAALILCMPGSYCWGVWLAANVGVCLPINADLMVCLAWPLAVLRALLSLAFYLRRPVSEWPWYVRVNLVVNISGLLFSLWVLSWTLGSILGAGTFPNLSGF